jgi:hypothetical protein
MMPVAFSFVAGGVLSAASGDVATPPNVSGIQSNRGAYMITPSPHW